VILEESLATQTFILTVHEENIDTHPLPGRFVTSLVDYNILLIALMVKMGIFNSLAIFLHPLSIL